MASPHGYLLVHFVEDPVGHAEKIYFSLSDGDDPLRWHRLNGGRSVLSSTVGTTGVRDPHIIRARDGQFHIVATDLRVWREEGQDWDAFQRHGSRSILVWDSGDLVHWDGPRAVEVAPPEAGMAWAPESFHDPETGDYVVHFASKLYADSSRQGDAVAQLMAVRTADFQSFGPAEPYLSLPVGVIDMTVAVDDAHIHRFAKQDDRAPDSWQVFHQRGSGVWGDDFALLGRNLGQCFGDTVEGPLVFKDNHEDRWYLWVDQYSRMPHGYHALTTTDLASGEWQPVDDADFHLPPDTKHGAVLPLVGDEWARLEAAFGGQ